MFNIPIDAIRIQDIEQFLQSGVREGTLLDFKEDFPKRLDKTISSMANTFGGMILIGVEETATGAGIVPIRGLSLGPGLRERVIQIGVSSVYPPLIPEVSVVEFKSDPALATPDKAVVVIRVHESEQGHAVDDRSTIYIRADNVSDRMRKATVEEVEWFLQKRQKSVTLKNRVIEQTKKHAHQFLVKLRHNHQRSAAEPFGRFVIWTIPSFPRSAIVTPKQLYDMTPELVRQLPGSVPGSFPYGLRRPVHDGISWANVESRFYCYTLSFTLLFSNKKSFHAIIAGLKCEIQWNRLNYSHEHA